MRIMLAARSNLAKDSLLQALDGASSNSTTNSDGSTSTIAHHG